MLQVCARVAWWVKSTESDLLVSMQRVATSCRQLILNSAGLDDTQCKCCDLNGIRAGRVESCEWATCMNGLFCTITVFVHKYTNFFFVLNAFCLFYNILPLFLTYVAFLSNSVCCCISWRCVFIRHVNVVSGEHMQYEKHKYICTAGFITKTQTLINTKNKVKLNLNKSLLHF